MLFRENSEGVVAITQPSHAWISGQLARAWGRDPWGDFPSREEVCLAAEQHDLGWLAWEKRPTFDSKTGLPYEFTELPVAVHLQIWSSAGPLALAYGPYVALLISLHGTCLYERLISECRDETIAAFIRDFLKRERRFQDQVRARLASGECPVDEKEVQRHRDLLAAWDLLSLHLCRGLAEELVVEGIPDAGGTAALTLVPRDPGGARVAVAPWPFVTDSLTLECSGRRLGGRMASEESMLATLDKAEWIRLPIHLEPG